MCYPLISGPVLLVLHPTQSDPNSKRNYKTGRIILKSQNVRIESEIERRNDSK